MKKLKVNNLQDTPKTINETAMSQRSYKNFKQFMPIIFELERPFYTICIGLAFLTISLFSGQARAAGGDIIGQYQNKCELCHLPEEGIVNGQELAQASVVDSEGNLIITGYTVNVSGDLDFYTIKINADLNTKIWQNSYAGPAGGDDWVDAIAVDSHNNVIITGHSFNGVNDDIITIKYDAATGAEMWAPYIFNGDANGDDRPDSVAVDHNNAIYIAGHSQTGSPQNGGSKENAILFKLNSGGPNADLSPIWLKNINGAANGDDFFEKVVADSSGVAVVGKTEIEHAGRTPAVDFDFLTMKYDIDGNLLWSEVYDNGYGIDDAQYVQMDSSGNVIVSGTVKGNGKYEILTIKYGALGDGNQNGDVLWQTPYAVGSPNEPRGIAIDAENDVYITGYTFSTGMDDYYTAKYAGVDGTPIWEKVEDNPDFPNDDTQDVAVGIAVDASGGLYVTGYTYKESTADYDFLTIKYNKFTGKTLWWDTFDGPSGGDDKPVGLAVAVGIGADGNVYVAGWSEETIGQVSNNDYYAIKYDAGLLDPPTDLTAVLNAADPSKIDLSWTDNSSGVKNEDFFCVERCSGWDCNNFLPIDCTVSQDTTIFQDSGLSPDTWYNYQVLAKKVTALGPPEEAEFSYPSNSAQELTTLIDFPAPEWVYSYDDSGSDDIAAGIAIGLDNDPVVTGFINSTVQQNNYYTVKLKRADPAAAVDWEAIYNDPDNQGDVGKGIAVDSNKDVIVTGFASLASGQQSNSNDIFTIKYDGENGPDQLAADPRYGAPLWAEQYAGPGNDDDRAESVAALTDINNDIVVIGYGKNLGQDDIYVIKYKSDCPEPPCNQEIWAASPYDHNNLNDYPNAMAFTPNGDVMVAGEVDIEYDTQGQINAANIFLAKYSGLDGSIMSGWPYVWDSGNGTDGINAVAVGSDGSIYVAGYQTSSSGDLDIYINKFDGNGNPQWNIDTLNPGYDEAVAIQVDPNDGDIVVASTFTGASGVANFTVSRYAPDGSRRWRTDLDRALNDDYAVAMSLAPNGDIAIVGDTDNGTDTDIIMIRLDHHDGSLLGSTNYDSGYDDHATDLVSNALGEFYASGYYGSDDGTAKDYDFLALRLKAGDIYQPPSPFTVTAHHSTIDLSWTKNEHLVNGYMIYLADTPCDDNGNTFTEDDIIFNALSSATSHTITGLDYNSQVYCVGIKSYHISSSNESDIIEKEVITSPPAAPDSLVATPQNTTDIELCWNDNNQTEHGFKVQRCSGVGCDFDKFDPNQDFTEFILDPGSEAIYCYTDITACDSGEGKTFSYRVESFGDSWATGYSNVEADKTAPALVAPANLSVMRVEDNSVELQWDDNSTDEDEYLVQRCNDTLPNCTPFPITPDQEFMVKSLNLDTLMLLSMDEATWDGTLGEVADTSGNANNSNAHGEMNTSPDRKSGRSAHFDGIDDYISTPLVIDQSAGSPGVTMMAWVKPAFQDYSRRALFSTGTAENPNTWGLYHVNDDWYIQTGHPTTTQATYIPAYAGQWQHVALVFEPGVGIMLYTNGTLRKTYSAETIVFNDATNPLTIGRNAHVSSNFFPGVIDEVAVFNQAVSLAEIQEIYNQTGFFAGKASYIDNVVSVDSNYTYQVLGRRNTPCGPEMSVPSNLKEVITTPQAPIELHAEIADSSKIYLSWTPQSSSHTGFVLESCTLATVCNFTELDPAVPAGATEYVDTSNCIGTAGTTRYRIKALWSGGETGYSNIAEVTVPLGDTPPGPVSITTFSEDTISLAWNYESTDHDGFTVSRCNGNDLTCAEGVFSEVSGSPSPALPSGILGLYHMDDYNWNGTAGEVIDSSGNGNHGKMVYAASIVKPGKYGSGAAYFSEYGRIETPIFVDQTSTGPGATFEAWVYPTTSDSTYRAIFSTNNTYNDYDWGLYHRYGVLYVSNGGNFYSIGHSLGVGLWSHVAAVFKPGVGVRIYLNGIEKTLNLIAYDSTTHAVNIGLDYSTSNRFWGMIDEVAIYGRALSSQEVLDRFNWTYRFVDTGLMAEPGTEFTYRITPHKDTICGDWDLNKNYSQASGTIDSSPVAPSAPAAIAVNSSQVRLSWANKTTSHTSLDIERCIGTDCFANIDTVFNLSPADTSFTDDTVCSGNDYSYRVKVNGPGWAGPVYSTAGFVSLGAILPPVLNLAELSESEVDIAWDEIHQDTEQYSLWRCQGDGVTACLTDPEFAPLPVFLGGIDGNILHYKMDEEVWTADPAQVKDSSGLNNHGQAYNGLSTVEAGYFDRGAEFNGTNQYISTGLKIDQSETSPGLTVSAWVYPTESTNYNYVFDTNNGGNDWGVMYLNNKWYIINGLDYLVMADIDLNQWQHIVAVFKPVEGVKFYKNGVESVVEAIGYDSSDNNVVIGRRTYSTSSSYHFKGGLDDIQIYERALDLTEVNRLVNENMRNWHYIDMNLDPNTQYTYKLTSEKSGACGWPMVSNGTVRTMQPPAPSLLAATSDTSNIYLTWQDNTGTETGFTLQRCSGSGASCDEDLEFTTEIPIAAEIESYVDPDLCAGVPYTYRIRADKDGSPGWPTAWDGPMSISTTSPVIPTGLEALSVSEVSIDISWNDETIDETGFILKRCIGGANCEEIDLGADLQLYSDTKLSPGTCYDYRIRAYKNASCPWPEEWSEPSVACTVPPTVGAVTASPLDTTSMGLSWTDLTETETSTSIERCAGDIATCCGGDPLACNDSLFDFVAKTGPNNNSFVDQISPMAAAPDCYNQDYTYRLKSSGNALSGSGGGAWTLRSPIIFNNGFEAFTGVEIIVSHLAGMNNDFSDIRFYDDTVKRELMTYWIKEKTAGVSATVWVMTGEYDSVYIYYGNPSAEDTSGTEELFTEIYDDFNGASIDTSKWVKIVPDDGYQHISQSGGKVRFTDSDNSPPGPWDKALISTKSFGRAVGNEMIISIATVGWERYRYNFIAGWGMDQEIDPANTQVMNGLYWHIEVANNYRKATSKFKPVENGVDGAVMGTFLYDVPVSYEVRIVSKDVGVKYYIKGGIYTDWTLLGETYNNYPGDEQGRISFLINSATMEVDSVSVRHVTAQLDAVLGAEEGDGITPFSFERTWVGDFSSAASGRTSDILSPSGIIVEAGENGEMSIGWNDNTADETGFAVERCCGAGCTFVPAGSTLENSMSFIDTPPASTDCTYQVKAFKDGSCPWVSNPETAAQPVLSPPAAPAGLTTTPLNGFQIELNWDDVSGVDGYELEMQVWNGGWMPVVQLGPGTGGQINYLDKSGINPNTKYYYRVRSVRGAAKSAYTYHAEPSPTSSETAVCTPPQQ